MCRTAFRAIDRFFQQVCLCLIRCYQLIVSPYLGSQCRFDPSCSEYAQIALRRYGCVYGLYLMVRRLLRCHPLHRGGADPVPIKKR